MMALVMSVTMMAEDHVMAATHGSRDIQRDVPDSLSLSLKEAQEYAIQQNRTLKNASLAVQEAYAKRGRLSPLCCPRQTEVTPTATTAAMRRK